MKQILYISILLTISFSCQDHNTINIRGEIKNLPGNQFFLYIENNQAIEIDTVFLSNKGIFDIRKQLPEPSVVTIIYPDKDFWLPLFLLPSEKVEIKADAQNPNIEEIQIKGSSVQKDLVDFTKANTGLLEEEDRVTKEVDRKTIQGGKGTTDHTRSLSNLYGVRRKISDASEDFILKNSNSLASSVLLNEFFNNGDIHRVSELIDSLEGDAKTFVLTRRMKEELEKLGKTEINKKAPGFKVQTLKGDTISLESLTKRNLLLSFTASWCEFCETEIKALMKCLEQYEKTAPITVVSISLDENNSVWKAFAKEHNITWDQVTDTTGTASTLLQLYNVHEVPYAVLIDTTGTIVGRGNSCDEFRDFFLKTDTPNAGTTSVK